MDERKFRILQAIIDDYILTAVPVGSRTISKKYDMGLSSATIRNEMSDLEELGYLDQPHVSAGRIPSVKAYRLYVDQLLKSGQIPDADPETVRTYFSSRLQQMEDVVGHAAQVLSSLTHYTALVMPPKGQELHIRNIQLVPVSSTAALVVIVTDAGIIKDAAIRTSDSLDSDALYAISRLLTEQLAGHTVGEAQTILSSVTNGFKQNQELLSGISALVSQVESKSATGRVMVGGTSNILNYPEYSDVEKARSFLALLETKDRLVELLSQQGQMAFTVRIGPETGIEEISDCSIVTATYSIGSHSHGTIGVIGPTRMHYSRVLAILNTMVRQLGNLFEEET
jgi:heat-inducible transcriptional repressor